LVKVSLEVLVLVLFKLVVIVGLRSNNVFGKTSLFNNLSEFTGLAGDESGLRKYFGEHI
jgi:hypothetical protein